MVPAADQNVFRESADRQGICPTREQQRLQGNRPRQLDALQLADRVAPGRFLEPRKSYRGARKCRTPSFHHAHEREGPAGGPAVPADHDGSQHRDGKTMKTILTILTLSVLSVACLRAEDAPPIELKNKSSFAMD